MSPVHVRNHFIECVYTDVSRIISYDKNIISLSKMVKSDCEYCSCVPIEGSSLLGFFQLKVMVFPVMDSITGVPSGGSGRMSGNEEKDIKSP